MNAQSKFVYIVSSPHGGSTLLSLVLGKHPQGKNLGEASFIPKLLALGELCTCEAKLSACENWGRVFDRLQHKTGCDLRASPYGLFLGDALKGREGAGLIDTSYQTPLRYYLGKARGAADTASLLGTPPGLLGLTTLPSVRESVRNTVHLYEAAAEAHDRSLIVDASKMPRKAPHLYRQDPERVRIIHLVRDGRGVVNSRKKYMPVPRSAERWHHYHQLTRRILDRWVPEQHRLRLRYEDFVGAPEEQLRSIFAWLEMDYSPECLEFGEHKVSHSAGGNPARFELAGGIREADDRWREKLTEKELQQFEAIAGPLNREFGYD